MPGQQMLAARGLTTTDDAASALVQRYSGNPLALRLVAQTVREVFDGDIRAFLEIETPIFDDIGAVLDQQMARLSPLEHELLTWLAIEREPVAGARPARQPGQPRPAARYRRGRPRAGAALTRRPERHWPYVAERCHRVPDRCAGHAGACARSPATCRPAHPQPTTRRRRSIASHCARRRRRTTCAPARRA